LPGFEGIQWSRRVTERPPTKEYVPPSSAPGVWSGSTAIVALLEPVGTMSAVQEEVLELWRGHDAHVDEGHPLGEAQYLLRRGDGGVRSASFPWSENLHRDLEAIHGPAPAQARERMGRLLRDFLTSVGWTGVEDAIARALKASHRSPEIRVTIRCSAGEMCRLPFELVPVQPSGEPLGLKEGCHVQWEWPETVTAPRIWPAPSNGGVLLFAWSTAGGALDAASQLRTVQRATGRHRHRRVEPLGNVSLATLRQTLETIRAGREVVAVLHLLCHGAELPGVEGGYGLALDRAGGGSELVDPATCASALAPYAGLVGCVVLSACDGANLAGSANFLGSVAQRLHRVGFPVVVASRIPLSSAGVEAFSEAFYDALLSGEPLHRAVAASRRQLQDEWHALQVYGRAKDGPIYPVVFRPYRGLQPFEESDRRFFFGRERLAQALQARTVQAWKGERPRFQVVAGTSGSGKSSLVKAGLIPELRATGWRIAMLRPGGDGAIQSKGLARLVRALRDVKEAPAAPGTTTVGSNESDEAAVMAEARSLRARWPDSPLLVVVDQLEESFQLEGEEPQRFLTCLWRLAADDALRVVVLSTFRADLLDRAEDMVLEPGVTLQTVVYREIHRLYAEGMSSEELLDAVRRPLDAVGLSFEPGLAEQLRDDAGKEPGALPLLEHVLDALWEVREEHALMRAAYERLGGLAGALSSQLDLLWDGLAPEQQRQGRRLLLALVDVARDVALSTRRRGQVLELRPSGVARASAFDAVLERLVERRLLVRGEEEAQGSAGSWVEIAHEALIRRWPRLQEWLKEEQQREQRAKVRRARLAAGGALFALLVVSALGGIAYSQRERARTAIAQALEVANEVVFTIDNELAPVGGAAPVRRKLLDRAALLQDRLNTATGGDTEARRLRGATHSNRGDLARSHDSLPKARQEYEAALRLAEASARADPDNAQLRRDLSVCYEKSGEVAQAEGDLEAAWSLFSKSLAIRETLRGADPDNAHLQRDLSVSNSKLAYVAEERKDLKSARALYSKSLTLAEALAEKDPDNAAVQHDLVVAYQGLGDVAQAGGDLKTSRESLSKALAITEALSKKDPGNAGLQRDLSVACSSLGDVARADGDLKGARELFSRGRTILEELGKADPGNANLQRDLSGSYQRLAVMAKAGGDLVTARELFSRSFAIADRLARADHSDASLQHDLFINHTKLGEVVLAEGDLKGARELFSGGLAIVEALAKADPNNAGFQDELSATYQRFGEVTEAQGDPNGARGLYSKALALREVLAKKDPGNAALQRDLFVNYVRLGDMADAGGDLKGARELFSRALAVSEALAKADPGKAGAQGDLSAACQRLGGVAEEEGDLKGAKELFSRSLAIFKALAKVDPGNSTLQRGLSVLYEKLGGVAEAEGDLEGAKELFSRDLAVADALAKADPGNAVFQHDLLLSYQRLGEIVKAENDLKGAKELFSRSLAITEALAKVDPDNAGYQRDLFVNSIKLGEVAQARGDLKAAQALFAKALALREAQAKKGFSDANLQHDLSATYEKLGEVAQAARDLERARDLFSKDLAITEALVKADPGSTGHQRDLAVCYERLGGVAQAGGDLEGARELFSKCLAIIEALAKADPTNTGLRRDLVTISGRLAKIGKRP